MLLLINVGFMLKASVTLRIVSSVTLGKRTASIGVKLGSVTMVTIVTGATEISVKITSIKSVTVVTAADTYTLPTELDGPLVPTWRR